MAHTEVPKRYSIQLRNRGRLVLSAEVRRRLDLHDGNRIILAFGDEGFLRLVSARQAARRTRGFLPPPVGRGLGVGDQTTAQRTL